MLTENPSDFGKQFLEAGRNFTRTLIQFMYALPVYKLIPTKPYKEFDVAVRRLLSLAGEIMEKKMAELTKAVEEGHELQGIGFLDQWLLEGKLSNDQILPIFGDLLAAGIDTVSQVLANCIGKHVTVTKLVSMLYSSLPCLTNTAELLHYDKLDCIVHINCSFVSHVYVYVYARQQMLQPSCFMKWPKAQPSRTGCIQS